MAMTRKEIFDKLIEILVAMDGGYAEIAPTITESTTLTGDLNLASVSMLYLIIAMEESFGILFDGTTVANNVGELVDYIQGKLN